MLFWHTHKSFFSNLNDKHNQDVLYCFSKNILWNLLLSFDNPLFISVGILVPSCSLVLSWCTTLSLLFALLQLVLHSWCHGHHCPFSLFYNVPHPYRIATVVWLWWCSLLSMFLSCFSQVNWNNTEKTSYKVMMP